MNRIQIPTFVDGFFDTYKVMEDTDLLATKYLSNLNIKMHFQQLSASDKLKSTLNANGVDVTTKIRIAQYAAIDSNCVLKINGRFHKVYNAYHFVDKQGFKLTDLTLTNWEGEYEER